MLSALRASRRAVQGLLACCSIWGGKFVAKGLAYDVTSCFILKAKKAHQDETSGNYRKDIVYDE